PPRRRWPNRTTAPRFSTRSPVPVPGPSAADLDRGRPSLSIGSLRTTAAAVARTTIREMARDEVKEIAEGGVPAPDPSGPSRKPPREAVAEAHVRAPTRGNRRLESFLDAVNGDDQVRGWWYMAQVNAERLGMSDHSWVHMQIILNISLRLLR